jgi:hypothetical protein
MSAWRELVAVEDTARELPEDGEGSWLTTLDSELSFIQRDVAPTAVIAWKDAGVDPPADPLRVDTVLEALHPTYKVAHASPIARAQRGQPFRKKTIPIISP